MKIMIISSLYGVHGGGSGIIARNLSHGLHNLGNDVTVITIGNYRRVSIEIDDGVKIYRFLPLNLYPLSEKDMHPIWQKIIWQLIDIYNFHFASIFRKILIREAPEIIHINKMRGFSGAVWSISSHLYPGRVIQTCHDYESMSPDGIIRGFVGKMALEKKWPVRGYQLIRASLSSRVSFITSPSRFTLEKIIDSSLFPNAQAIVIPNTHGYSEIQLKNIHAKNKQDLTNKEIRFLFIGRLESEKGIQGLIEAFIQIYSHKTNIHLDVAGYGLLEDQLRKKYKNHPGIHFLGLVDGESKNDAFSDASVVLVPSLVDEVFGLVVVEAYAFGKPVIASNVGGLPELVREDETGWLVKPGDVHELREKLENVTNLDLETYSRICKNCMAFSYSFSKEKVLKKYEEIYRRCLL